MIIYNDPSTTYDNLGIGYGGFTIAPATGYSVVIRDFVDAANDDFSPGDVIAFIDSPHYLAWSEYVNEVGEAFFTISQRDIKAAVLASLETKISYRPHMEVLRNGEKVWGGWLGEIDETTDDLIVYGYSYLSGFFDVITAWDDKWVGNRMRTIVRDLLDGARDKTDSRVHWIKTGTIEDPVTTSGGATAIVMPLYRAPYKRVLQAWKEMSAYAISDTTNHVIFEITPDGTFNFWKHRYAENANVGTSYPHGHIRSYRRIRRPVSKRSKLYGVGTSPTDVNLQESVHSTSLLAAMGLSEEPLYFSFVRDPDELERVSKLRLSRAARTDTQLFISFYRDTIIPFRATGATYKLGDMIHPKLDNGATVISETPKVVAGQQVVWSGKRENVRLLLGDSL